ncbi:MAG: PTS sugar transporter subunit IIA [Thermoanaerobaculia bacterium]
MIPVLLVTHGRLAQELLAAAETIAGVRPELHALSLEWNEGIDAARQRIAQAIAAVDQGLGVLVLTDMYGSTPSNAAIALSVPGRIEVVTGVNLPMVVRMSCSSILPGSVVETARWLEEKGKRSITRGSAPEPVGGAAPAPVALSPCVPGPPVTAAPALPSATRAATTGTSTSDAGEKRTVRD